MLAYWTSATYALSNLQGSSASEGVTLAGKLCRWHDLLAQLICVDILQLPLYDLPM